MNRIEQTYTSLELSKFLKEKGFDLEAEYYWNFNPALPEQGWYFDNENLAYQEEHTIKSYDILNDLCGRYAKEVFGDDDKLEQFEDYYLPTRTAYGTEVDYSYQEGGEIETVNPMRLHCSFVVIILLQQGKKEEAEQDIIDKTKQGK